MIRNTLAVAVAVFAVMSAAAQITQWNSNIASSAYTIDNTAKSITIDAPASDQNEIFSFEAWETRSLGN